MCQRDHCIVFERFGSFLYLVCIYRCCFMRLVEYWGPFFCLKLLPSSTSTSFSSFFSSSFPASSYSFCHLLHLQNDNYTIKTFPLISLPLSHLSLFFCGLSLSLSLFKTLLFRMPAFNEPLTNQEFIARLLVHYCRVS